VIELSQALKQNWSLPMKLQVDKYLLDYDTLEGSKERTWTSS
jgi:hypothetical protein